MRGNDTLKSLLLYREEKAKQLNNSKSTTTRIRSKKKSIIDYNKIDFRL